jgi:hypothetical protein
VNIHDAFMGLLALSPPLTIHQGKVPASPTFPYVLVAGSVPRVAERGVTRVPQGAVAKYRTTITGTSENSVRIIAARVANAIEGARLDVPGYLVGRVESLRNDLPIMEDNDVTINSMHPFYTVLEWQFTVCPT